MDLSAIILSYNRRDELLSTLKIVETDPDVQEVVVVDNGSSDGSPDMVAQCFQKVRLIRLSANIGIAGWNLGMQQARGKYLLLLDDDSAPVRGDLARAIHHLDHRPDCGILALAVSNLNGEANELTNKAAGPCSTFIGCGVVIRKTVVEMIGGFYEPLFIYCHELEYTMRALERGIGVHYDPCIHVVHRVSNLMRGRLVGRNLDDRRVYYNYRNQIFILLSRFDMYKVLLRIGRLIAGRWLFHMRGGGLPSFISGVSAGMILYLKHRHEIPKLAPEIQQLYSFGAFVGGFFADGVWGFRRPRFLQRVDSV